MLPLASGSRLILKNTSSTGAPNDSTSIASVAGHLCTGAWSCSSPSTAHKSPGNTSGRVLDHCAHLMNAAPECLHPSSRKRHAVRRRRACSVPVQHTRMSAMHDNAVSLSWNNTSISSKRTSSYLLHLLRTLRVTMGQVDRETSAMRLNIDARMQHACTYRPHACQSCIAVTCHWNALVGAV